MCERQCDWLSHGRPPPRALRQAVWPAGFHMGMPWRLRVSNLVTKQNVVFDLPVKGCTTKDNVTVEIDVAIVFRIMGDKTRVRNEGVRTCAERR